MQDIVFYAAANETLGVVRDYANVRNQSAPILVLGVSVCLRMRLFADSESTAAYPVTSFSDITTWKWRMDADFDRDTPSKLVADTGDISVQTVTDTINGETLSFTEFAIPISDMNTVELTEWLGTEKKRSGLTGELVGYDSSGNAVFVLQIDDFTVRNRVAGLNEPTSNQQVYLTSSQTELLVQSAVSSLATTKQDSLTSANAGVGIEITSGGTISASGVPMGAVTGLTAALSGLESGISGKQDKLSSANAGANISVDSNGVISNTYSLPYAATNSAGGVMLATGAEIVSGNNTSKAITPAALNSALTGGTSFVPQDAISPFRTITDLGNAATVSLAAGGAYKLSAISGDHYITVSEVPSGKYGMDAHLELFVGAATLVHTLDPLILMDALVPNAVNDCVIEYRDGTARMFVEDHAVGYVVTIAGGTTGTELDGSLYYSLTGTTQSYIVFANSLDGQTIDFGTASNSVARNIVGNGAGNTTITGTLTSSASLSVSSLTMNGVSLSSSNIGLVSTTMTGTASIVSGSTATFSGMNVLGGTVSNAGIISIRGGTLTSPNRDGYIDMKGAGSYLRMYNSTVAGCTITGWTGYNGAVYPLNYAGWKSNLIDCLVTGNTAVSGNGGGFCCYGLLASPVIISGSTFSNNKTTNNNRANAVFLANGNYEIHNTIFEENQTVQVYQRDEGYNIILIDGMTCSPGTSPWYIGDGQTHWEVTLRIQAGSLNVASSAYADTAKFIGSQYSVLSVGSYDANGVWVIGGTASFVTNSGSTVSLSGIGTYVNANGDTDLSFTKNNWEPITLRAAIVTDEELTFTGANALIFHSEMPVNAIVANPVHIAAGASLNIAGVSSSFGDFSHFEIVGSTVTNTGQILGATVTIPANGDTCQIAYENAGGSTVSATIASTAEIQTYTVPGKLISCANT